MFNLGSSYFHVALTTVRHLLNVETSALPSARIAYASELHPLQQSRDSVDVPEKLLVRRKLRPDLQRLIN